MLANGLTGPGTRTLNISEYLLARLHAHGVEHVFGIPGDYVLSFFDALSTSPVEHVSACNELNAGYAADGYARLRGLGAVAVTYGVGSLGLASAVAGAYAERVPVVVICGGPRRDAARSGLYLHHVLPKRPEASLKVFEQITAAAARLEDPAHAPAEIDALLGRCLAERRPVYLEIPVDLQTAACAEPGPWPGSVAEQGDPATAATAVQAIVHELLGARHCVALVGHEIRSAGLEDALLDLVDRTGLPVGSLFSGKPEFLEQHPRCIGLYQGLGSLEEVADFVEGADVVVWLGAVPSDFNVGGMPERLARTTQIRAFDDRVQLPGQAFEGVRLEHVLDGLRERLPAGHWSGLDAPRHGFAHRASEPYSAVSGRQLTNKRLYDRLAHFIRPGDIVCGDGGPGVNLAYLQFPRDSRCLGSGYWAAIGSGFGFALGACFARAPGQRVVAVVGDGAFQMTAQELSTMVRYGEPAIVILVNNAGYTVERLIHDGPFNDIPGWRYHALPSAFGGVAGLEVRTEDELDQALASADAHRGPGPLLIEVHLDPFDVPEAFKRIGARLRRGE